APRRQTRKKGRTAGGRTTRGGAIGRTAVRPSERSLLPSPGSARLETVKFWQELGDLREMRFAGPQTGASVHGGHRDRHVCERDAVPARAKVTLEFSHPAPAAVPQLHPVEASHQHPQLGPTTRRCPGQQLGHHLTTHHHLTPREQRGQWRTWTSAAELEEINPNG